MRKYFLIAAALVALMSQPTAIAAQQLAKPVYMQIFYQGTGWLADQPLLCYSPAFRGRTRELVQEDSTRAIAPGASVFDAPAEGMVQHGETSITTTEGTFVPDGKGRMRPQTSVDLKKQRLAEKARFSRSFNLLNARATLAYSTLTNALNEAATDGWEVVQIASTGNGGGLVYLLQQR